MSQYSDPNNMVSKRDDNDYECFGEGQELYNNINLEEDSEEIYSPSCYKLLSYSLLFFSPLKVLLQLPHSQKLRLFWVPLAYFLAMAPLSQDF